MCSKGSPSTTQQQTENKSQSSSTQGQQLQTGFSQLGPNPDTLALYNQFLQNAGSTAQAPFDFNMELGTSPWTDAQTQAALYQMQLGQQGMGFVPQAAGMIGGGGASTMGQIPGAASSIRSPYGEQAAEYGMAQGQKISDWGTSHGDAISDYAIDLAARGPQLQQFSQGAIDQYMSPYINDVVNTTQNQFTNANAQQGNVLLGQGIKSGNAFGGDRAGVAAAQMANQQQLAQAPVIANLYNQGYTQALGEYNTQNQLAAQLGQMAIQGQTAGGQLGLQGLTAGGQMAMQGLGMGSQDWNTANQQAIGALGQNQNAAIQGGQGLGQLGALQYSQNLAGGAQANQAAAIQPAWLQQLMNNQAQNAQMYNAYPFQTSSWYGGLLQGIGGLTGTQQQNVNAALSNYLTNQQGTSLINGSTTPPSQNSWLQAAGLGIAGLGLLAKRGGAVPRMPHRAVGGGIPRYAGGGPAGGPPGMMKPDLNFLTGGFGDAIPKQALQATHLAAPNTAATDIKLPVLSTLTFPGMSQSGAGTGTQGSQSTLGQAGALLGNKQVQSGLKGIGGMLFGNNDVSVAALGSGSDVVGTEPSGGPNPLFRRGGTVAMRHYPSGGFVSNPYADNPDVDEEEPTNDFGWLEDMFKEPKPDTEALPEADSGGASFNDRWNLTEGEPSVPQEEVPIPRPGPEPRDDFVPEPYADELAQPDDQPQPMSPEAQGQPERQAGIGPQRGGGRGGRGRPERIDFPGQQGAPQGFLSRWANNPLTQFGIGLASAKGAGMTGVAEGLAMGLNRVQAQQIANDKLDRNYKLDTSGDTTRLVFPTHAIDTKLPTGRAKLAQQQRMGRVPAGMMMNDEGVLVPMRGLPQKAAASQPPVVIGEDKYGGKTYGVPDPDNPGGYLNPITRKPVGEQPAQQVPRQTAEAPAAEATEDISASAQLTQGSIGEAFTENGVDIDRLLQDPPTTGTAREKRPEVLEQYPDVAKQVIAISEGRSPAPTGSRKDRTSLRIMEALHEYDPQSDASMYGRRNNTARNFATGVEGRNLTAANTFGQHLNEMSEITEQLKNGGWPSITAARNAIARQAGDLSPDLKRVRNLLGRFDIVSKALGDEGAKVFAGQQSALADREGWADRLPQASDPVDVARSKMSAMVKLVDGRLSAVATQYNNGMNTSHKPMDFLAPKTRQVFDRIRNVGGDEKPAAAEKAGGAPAAKTAAPTGEQQRALDWANSHPDDPRAKEIKKRLGQ